MPSMPGGARRHAVWLALALCTLVGCDSSAGSPHTTDAGGTGDAGTTPPPPPGECSGFESLAREWTLPYPLLSAGNDFDEIANDSHAVFDIDGDGLPEFVVIDDVERSERDALVGRHHWLVFESSASGFDDTPREWTLPYSLRPAGSDFNQLQNTNHAVFDIDGDGRVEFVVMNDVERAESDALVGRHHWLVFDATETGFDTTPREWLLPYPLVLAGQDFNALATSNHAIVDLDGDARPDFVVIDDVERAERDALVGRHHWLVFGNTGTGFDTAPREWVLPYSLLPAGRDFNELATSSHVLLDMDGDGRSDFVVVDDVERAERDALVGRHHWLVFDNTGAGFDTAPREWALPYSLLPEGRDFNEITNAAHALLDLDGDGRLEFVVIDDVERAERDALVGRHHWLVFDDTSEGFETTPREWVLPYPLLSTAGDFNELGNAYHTLLDLDGDGRLEFVVIDDAERSERDALVGRRHWLSFHPICEH